MGDGYESRLIRCGHDTTIRISFRAGDFLLHIRPKGIINTSLTIVDLWELRDGQYATLTNRVEDLPEWFLLHPTEVCGALAYSLVDRFNRGEYPATPIDGPNIWRVMAGDTLIWIGESRPDIPVKSDDGLLRIFTFSECMLVVGEPVVNLHDAIGFGALSENPNSMRATQARRAVSMVRSMGISRTVSTFWCLG